MSGPAPIFGALSDGVAAVDPRRGRALRSRGVSARKNAIAAALVALIPLSAIAAGGTVPLLWPVLAVATGAIGLVAAFGIPAGRKPVRPGIAVILLCGALPLGYGLLQVAATHLPVASLHMPDRSLMLRPGSLSPDATLMAVLRGAAALMILWLMLCVSGNPARRRAVGLALFAGIVAQAVWALMMLGPLGERHISAYPGSAVGTFIGRNALATHLGIGLVLGLAVLPGRQAPVLWVGLAIIGMALLSTQSRMGVVAAAAGALVILLNRRPGWRSGMALALAATLGLAMFGQGLAERIVWLASAWDTRAELYAQVWQIIAARPLTGFGLDAFPLAFEIFHRPPVPSEVVWDRAHSTYLTLWAEAGLLFGSLPPLAGALALVLLYRRRADPFAAAAMAALVLAALHSVFDFSLEISANLFLLLALVGLGLGAAIPAKG